MVVFVTDRSREGDTRSPMATFGQSFAIERRIITGWQRDSFSHAAAHLSSNLISRLIKIMYHGKPSVTGTYRDQPAMATLRPPHDKARREDVLLDPRHLPCRNYHKGYGELPNSSFVCQDAAGRPVMSAKTYGLSDQVCRSLDSI